ncbi:MAG: methyltransferase domain-containing protein [Gemmataceae bacterium]
MSWWPDLSQRQRMGEAMDRPDLDRESHLGALRGLEKLNRWSKSARILWPALRQLARANPKEPLRVLDVACGGGDVALSLWRLATRAGFNLQISGCDFSPRAVEFARREAVNAGAQERGDSSVRYFVMDVLKDVMPTHYDAIVCSLFLHHLERPQAVELLRRMGQAAGRLVLVNDLVRSRLGLLLARAAVKFLTDSWVCQHDGPRSVVSAFTPSEAASMAEEAGLHGAVIRRRWPFRYLLSWKVPANVNGDGGDTEKGRRGDAET